MSHLTPAGVHAIENVLMFNRDICDLYEKRGVSRDDLREVFRLATLGTHYDVAEERPVVESALDWLTFHGDELKKYNNEHVAVSADGVVAHDPDVVKLNARVKELGMADKVIFMAGPFDPPQ